MDERCRREGRDALGARRFRREAHEDGVEPARGLGPAGGVRLEGGAVAGECVVVKGDFPALVRLGVGEFERTAHLRVGLLLGEDAHHGERGRPLREASEDQ